MRKTILAIALSFIFSPIKILAQCPPTFSQLGSGGQQAISNYLNGIEAAGIPKDSISLQEQIEGLRMLSRALFSISINDKTYPTWIDEAKARTNRLLARRLNAEILLWEQENNIVLKGVR